MEISQTIKEIEPKQEIHNFDEISLGFSEKEAIKEASRCLNCVNSPCVKGCPINNRIPEFIGMIKSQKYDDAYNVLISKSPFPEICSRVCNSEEQCMKNCTRGIKENPIRINLLERFVCDKVSRNKIEKTDNNKIKVAIIGGGPSGMTVAKILAIDGYDITIYEANNNVGGVLTYGIPNFRLPKNIVENEIENLKQLDVKIITNKKINSYKGLLSDYDYIYIAIGAWKPKLMGIEGETLDGVYDANKFLFEVNSDIDKIKNKIENKNVVIIGGGNVAMDAARCAIRLNANSVNIYYRRTEKEMPANNDELRQAKQEGVNIIELVLPKQIIGENNKVKSIKCVRTKLSDEDESGRRKPIEIEGSEFRNDVDVVIEAINSNVDTNLLDGILLNKNGNIIVNEKGKTNITKIYAGGDVVTGPATVIGAVKAGIDASTTIKEETI